MPGTNPRAYNVQHRWDQQGPQRRSPLDEATLGSVVGSTVLHTAGAAGLAGAGTWLARHGSTGRLASLATRAGVAGSVAASVGVGLAVGSAYLSLRWADLYRSLRRTGMEHYLDRAYSTSRQRLEGANLGLRSQVAHTMRQRMLQTLHNSAYYGRQVMGREAEILHA